MIKTTEYISALLYHPNLAVLISSMFYKDSSSEKNPCKCIVLVSIQVKDKQIGIPTFIGEYVEV